MYKQLIKASLLSATMIMFTACKDDDNEVGGGENELTTYSFERNNESSVSFSGQTTRLAMAKEVVGYFNNGEKDSQGTESAFAHIAKADDFADEGSLGLNASSKSVYSKVAASKDLFPDSEDGIAIKTLLNSYIKNQFLEVTPNKDNIATSGNAGYLMDGDTKRYVNAKGLEYNQAFAKSLIGALIVDQVLNNYLGTTYITNQEYIDANSAETLKDGTNYTTYEHHYDEAYGYVYGDPSVDSENPTSYEGDAFLFKYIEKVDGDSDFSGIQEDIFEAFLAGRKAIVAKEYEALDAAIEVLQYEISKVIGVRAVYYLQAGKRALAAQENGDAFHSLSEGYGFVNSLQFTRNPATGLPYFSASEVDAFIVKLETGNGFWDLTTGTVLDEISDDISAKFDFTTAEAAE